MNEPLIRVVKKAELGSRETFILRLEAVSYTHLDVYKRQHTMFPA